MGVIYTYSLKIIFIQGKGQGKVVKRGSKLTREGTRKQSEKGRDRGGTREGTKVRAKNGHPLVEYMLKSNQKSKHILTETL